MQIYKIDTTRARDVRTFIRLPFAIYRDCPQWVPPLLPDMRAVLNRSRYPFYRQSDADFFLAEQEGQTLGRIAVLENRPYNEYHGTKVAFFYFFESVNDRQVSRALFDVAFDWARARGLDTVYGPHGMLRSDAKGLLIEGFEHRPAIGVPYNLAYYQDLIEDVGFEKELDYVSGYLSKEFGLPQRLYDIAEKVKARRGYWIKPFNSKAELRRFTPMVHKIYEQAFTQVWGYYPVSEQEMRAMVDRIAAIANPRLIKVVMKGEEAIGFVISYPDISAAIQRIKGRLWPVGWIALLIESKRTKCVNFNGVGVIPRYHGIGANAVLYSELAKTFLDYDFEFGDYVQIAETNQESLRDAAMLGVPLHKRHRLYRYAL